MLPRHAHCPGDIVQRQVRSELLPDKLLHFSQRALRGRIHLFATPYGRGKVAHEGEAEAQIESGIEGRFGKGSKLRPSAQLEQRMHAAGERNRPAERVELFLERRRHSFGMDGEPTMVSFMLAGKDEVLAVPRA